jgi:ATP-dependent DNA ligase
VAAATQGYGPGVALPLAPPLAPALARLSRELPVGPGWSYEPKWDGFRCVAFRDGDDVDLRSRNDRPLARYFPEVVAGLRTLPEPRVVLDGELLACLRGRPDFPTLMSRLHPAASRVERLAVEAPATYVAFDLLALGDDVLLDLPYAERRARLDLLLADSREPVVATTRTDDPAVAAGWLDAFPGGGADGVVAKPADLVYRPGRRDMVKVKREHTVDCVVAGLRFLDDEPVVSSLLLGLYDDEGALHHVGAVQAFPAPERARLARDLAPLRTALAGHPWEHGFALEGGPTGRLRGAAGRWRPGTSLDWLPLRPERVCEVAYDRLDGRRFRHPARLVRWRPDRDPASCRVEQLAGDPPGTA